MLSLIKNVTSTASSLAAQAAVRAPFTQVASGPIRFRQFHEGFLATLKEVERGEVCRLLPHAGSRSQIPMVLYCGISQLYCEHYHRITLDRIKDVGLPAGVGEEIIEAVDGRALMRELVRIHVMEGYGQSGAAITPWSCDPKVALDYATDAGDGVILALDTRGLESQAVHVDKEIPLAVRYGLFKSEKEIAILKKLIELKHLIGFLYFKALKDGSYEISWEPNPKYRPPDDKNAPATPSLPRLWRDMIKPELLKPTAAFKPPPLAKY